MALGLVLLDKKVEFRSRKKAQDLLEKAAKWSQRRGLLFRQFLSSVTDFTGTSALLLLPT